MQDESMEEFRDRIERYHGNFDEAFQGIKNDFLVASPAQRIGWLQNWDNALSQESRVTKSLADYVSKRRELGDLHEVLKRAGR